MLYRHKDVAEAAVVGAADDLRGQVPVGLIVLKQGATVTKEQVIEDSVQMVRQDVGAVAAFKSATVVDRLPKTRSGKIMRRILRKIAEDDFSNLGDTSTLADPGVVEDLIDNRQNKSA